MVNGIKNVLKWLKKDGSEVVVGNKTYIIHAETVLSCFAGIVQYNVIVRAEQKEKDFSYYTLKNTIGSDWMIDVLHPDNIEFYAAIYYQVFKEEEPHVSNNKE
jgi:hypothetical protein